MSGSSGLESLVGGFVTILTTNGRHFLGVLQAVDQATNVCLTQAHERVYCKGVEAQDVPLGVYLIRGDTVALIGSLDQQALAALPLRETNCDPFPPMRT